MLLSLEIYIKLCQNTKIHYMQFRIKVVVLDVLGLPAIAITSASLFTKLIDNKVQGLDQGYQRGVLGIGMIIGPLSAGPLVQKPLVLIGISLCFITFILILVVVSFKRLKPKSTAR